MSTIALDAMACTVTNFENLTMHVRKRVPSVEKMFMSRISPQRMVSVFPLLLAWIDVVYI